MTDYWYIGKDGIRVLARSLEDERDRYKAALERIANMPKYMSFDIGLASLVAKEALK